MVVPYLRSSWLIGCGYGGKVNDPEQYLILINSILIDKNDLNVCRFCEYSSRASFVIALCYLALYRSPPPYFSHP
jgi:hypothetical protein